MATCRLILSSLTSTTPTSRLILNHVQRRHMPVNVPPTATGKRRFRMAVECDPHKLVNYCCGLNYHVDEQPVKLKDDTEYPDWLWSLRLGPVPNSWELEEGSKEYYLRLNEEQKNSNYLKRMTSGGRKMVVDKVLLKQQEYLKRLRFAALAHLEDDAGLEMNSGPNEWQQASRIQVNASDYYLPMEEERVIYADKIPGNIKLKNFHYDYENSFNKASGIRTKPYAPIKLKAIQDSKRRHRHTGT